jgi:hypothetical protein
MSNNYWDEEDDDLDTETEAPLDGSDLLKKLRKAKRADEKRIKELTEQLETFSKAQRESTLKEVLEKKGVNTKAARLILKDISEVNEESINNWLSDNGDLIGYQPKSNNDDMNLAALRQQDVVTQQGISPDKANDMNARLNGNFESAEDFIAFLQSQQ